LVDRGRYSIGGPPASLYASPRATPADGRRLVAMIGRRNPRLSTRFGTAVASRAGPAPGCKNGQSRGIFHYEDLMHILFLSHYFKPEVNAPASRTYENAKRWVRYNHQVTVLTCAPNCPEGVVYPGYANKLWSEEVIDGIRVVRVWTFIAANEGTIKRTLNYLSYLASASFAALVLPKPDVLIATSPQFFCGWAGVIASRIKRVPFLLEIRDIWPEGITAAGGLKNANRAVGWVEKMAMTMYGAADHIVTVGGGYKQKLINKGVAAEKISIVTNGVDLELFTPRPADPDLLKRHGLGGKFVVAYIGTIGMACALDVVLRAARRMKERGDDRTTFLLVGDGANRRQLEQQAQQEGLDNVVFTGRQDKSLMPDYLAASDACLVHLRKTPLYETVLPSKIFEAAAMERPIILGVKGFAAGLVADAGAGLCIEPESEDDLLEAIGRLLENPALRGQFGQSGRASIVRDFNRDTLAQNYLDVIGRVLITSAAK
jgi:glycosyltransferase involved in cell wall biosynthesis